MTTAPDCRVKQRTKRRRDGAAMSYLQYGNWSATVVELPKFSLKREPVEGADCADCEEEIVQRRHRHGKVVVEPQEVIGIVAEQPRRDHVPQRHAWNELTKAFKYIGKILLVLVSNLPAKSP